MLQQKTAAVLDTRRPTILSVLGFFMVLSTTSYSRAESQKPGSPDPFEGSWRIKKVQASLAFDSTLNDSEKPDDSRQHPLEEQMVSIDDERWPGIRCRVGQKIPPSKKTLYLLSLGDKKDYAFRELERAMKTCQIGELRNTSSRYLENLTEISISCSFSGGSQRSDPSSRELTELQSMTLLSQKYALTKSKNNYLCLEKIPPLVEKPLVMTQPLRVKKTRTSPLEGPKIARKSLPNFCPVAFFTEPHPDESPLGLWLGKSRIIFTEAVEAALSTCEIPMGGKPQRAIRLMKHFEVLCGNELKRPTAESGFIEWLTVRDSRSVIVSAGGQFYCLEAKISVAH